MRHLPPLTALPAFEATARLGSVTAAAAELGRTHSAVSKQLRHLAEDLGGDLFEKLGTGLRLTDRGRHLQDELRPLLDRLNRVAEELRRSQDQSRVRLALSATFATRWLTPRLPQFYARHPGIEIDLMMSGPHRELNEGFDLFLSYDRLRGPMRDVGPQNYKGVPFQPLVLGDTAYGPVCAPGFTLQGQGLEWQAELRLVHSGAPQSWEAWSALSGKTLRAAREASYPHHILALEAAAAGLGISIAERRLVEEDLASGRLIAPFGFITVKDGLLARIMEIPGAQPAPSPAVLALVTWLKDMAAPKEALEAQV
ncbi:LysR substrate-binding domain-containing protein [Arenibacterium sp. LLYu02]|uniref:LysR substrate-binding domain-containing protein n=1 Tax=Arenibacterium sp. LLYu02 TaxID=3404132 RepID=UPI003B21E5C3